MIQVYVPSINGGEDNIFEKYESKILELWRRRIQFLWYKNMQNFNLIDFLEFYILLLMYIFFDQYQN